MVGRCTTLPTRWVLSLAILILVHRNRLAFVPWRKESRLVLAFSCSWWWLTLLKTWATRTPKVGARRPFVQGVI